MNTGRTVFSQVMDFLPMRDFRRYVARYRGHYKAQSFSCLDQFMCMVTYRESLRDIEACLRAVGPKLYHAGFRGRISRSTLADANENRDWRIYADFAQVLIGPARKLYANEDFGLELAQTVYALDSTTIDLCLSLFPWAKFRKRKGAIKLHTLLDLRGNIPTLVVITHGKVHDVNVLDDLPMESGAIYVMDRGYMDFSRLFTLHLSAAHFVTCAKKGLDFKRMYSRPVDKASGLQCDQTIILRGYYSRRDYPEKLRRVRYYDLDTNKRFVFLTNNFTLPAITIAELYRFRWRVELFFKWIKQHLRIKSFFGTSPNAVKTQIWIAISIYVLVAIMKKELNLERSLYEILQIISVTVLEKTPVLQALTAPCNHFTGPDSCNQLRLFDF